MPLEITYWTGSAPENRGVYGTPISNEQRTLSGVSAQSGATPDGTAFVSITATEAARFEYSSSNPTASVSSVYLLAGRTIDIDARPGFKIAGITA
jgi:hypothetical protein